jgi:hypothetical protein
MVPISVMAMVNSTLNLMDCMLGDKWLNVGKTEAQAARKAAMSTRENAVDTGKVRNVIAYSYSVFSDLYYFFLFFFF